MLEAIGFDFDDTILKRERAEIKLQAEAFVRLFGGNVENIANGVLAELHGGLPHMRDYFVVAGRDPTFRTNAEYDRFEPVFNACVDKVYTEFANQLAKKGIIKLLHALREIKKTRRLVLFVVSGTSVERITNALTRFGVPADMFDEIVCSRDKTNIVKQILGEYKIRPERALFVGNSLLDLRVAKDLGTRFLGIKPERAGKKHSELIRDGARVLDDFASFDRKIQLLDPDLSLGIRSYVARGRQQRKRFGRLAKKRTSGLRRR